MAHVSICEWIDDNRVAVNNALYELDDSLNKHSIRIQKNATEQHNTASTLQQLTITVEDAVKDILAVTVLVGQLHVSLLQLQDEQERLTESIHSNHIAITDLQAQISILDRNNKDINVM